MLGFDAARLHAALNDVPAALLVAAVLFDLGAWLRRRESLAWASIWCLWAGVLGGWAAVIAGNLAEEAIDHGDAIHEIMQRHERLGLIVMGFFTALLLWKLWRRAGRPAAEEWTLRVLGVAGLVGLYLVASLGGRMVFDHAAGVTNAKMIAELKDRKALPPPADSATAAGDAHHSHPPGTPAHEH
jgi:uncharacterized membrane protein